MKTLDAILDFIGDYFYTLFILTVNPITWMTVIVGIYIFQV